MTDGERITFRKEPKAPREPAVKPTPIVITGVDISTGELWQLVFRVTVAWLSVTAALSLAAWLIYRIVAGIFGE